MKLKEMWKRFWTLDVHNHAGFTLVELIIVIAILAILSTGAIAGYSAYVEKANKTADQALVAEIENVLLLHYYNNGGSGAGYVAISMDNPAEANDWAIEALREAYGENWDTALKLKYADWNFTNYFDGLTAEDISLIAGSSYMNVSTDSLMGAVTNLTDAATTVIKNYSGDVEGKLSSLLGDEFVDKLNATGVTVEDEEYETVVSNLMVSHFANAMSGLTVEEATSDELTGMVLLYASLAAYSDSIGDTTQLDKVNEYIATSTNMNNLSASALAEYISTNTDSAFYEDFESYYVENAASDNGAVLKIMGAVSDVAGNITDIDDLSNANLYASEMVESQLNGYITAVKALAYMGLDPSSLPQNALIVCIADDGSVKTLGMD